MVGPASSVFAYLYAFFKEIDFISEELFWVGYPFAYIIPGSVVNGTLYYAVLVDGLRGLIISSICFYLPSFISLFGILPNWKYYRSKAGVQRLTKGLTCVSTGLMTAMVTMYLNTALHQLIALRLNRRLHDIHHIHRQHIPQLRMGILLIFNRPDWRIAGKCAEMGADLLQVVAGSSILRFVRISLSVCLLYNFLNVAYCYC